MVSAAICLTALIGCLSVSAAEGDTPVYTVVSAEGEKGGTVGVNVTGADLTKICGQSVDIKFAAGLEIGKVRDNLNNRDLVLVNDETGGEYNILSNEDGTKTVRLVDIINFPQYGDTPPLETSSFNVTISVTIPTNASAGTVYSIIFDESQFADLNEKWVYPQLIDGKITVVADAPVCTHENLEFVSAVPATEEVNGTITFECADCGEQITEDVTYLMSSLLATPSIGCTSTTQLILRANITNYANSEDGIAVVTHKYGNGAADETMVFDVADAENDGSYYRWIIGVKSIHFTDTFTSVFYTKRDGQWVSGMVRDFSVKDSAMSVVTSSTSAEAMKRVAANLLKMGAEAQSYFNYNTSLLADAELVGDYAQYVTTTKPSVEKNESNYIPVSSDFVEKQKVALATPSISLGDAISFSHKAVTTYYSNPDQLTDVKLMVSYTSFNGAPISEAITDYSVDEKGRLLFNVDVIAPNMRELVSVTVYNGDSAVSDTATYSIESVLAAVVLTDPSVEDLVNAIINYSDSAQSAF